MYAAPALRTTHRLVRLDVPTPSWMRAPGKCPGMYALESAMDELAAAAGIDPVELRVLNDPETEPESGCRSAPATWWPASGRAPAGSDGRAGTRNRESAGRGVGWSVPAWPLPCIRSTGDHLRPRRRCGMAASWCGSRPLI